MLLQRGAAGPAIASEAFPHAYPVQEQVAIPADFRAMYDSAVQLWADLDVAIKGAREDGALVSRLANGIR